MGKMYQLAEKPNPVTPAFISNDLQVAANHLLCGKKKHTHSVENRQCCAKRLCYFAKKIFSLCAKYLFPCLLICCSTCPNGGAP